MVRPPLPFIGAALLHKKDKHTSNAGGNHTENHSRDFDQIWPQEQNQSVSSSHLSVGQSARRCSFDVVRGVGVTGNNQINDVEAIPQLAPPIDAMRTIREHHVTHVASECEYIASILFVFTQLNIR
jgi:hypothetical protein